MIRIGDISLPVDYDTPDLRRAASSALKIKEETIQKIDIVKRSIDARKKDRIHYIFTLDVTTKGDENAILRRAKNNKAQIAAPKYYVPPKAERMPKHRPVVVGFGPAGMFCALVLAQAGLRPIVLERGCDAETRREKVALLRETGELDPECNVQFGEGGAGTFSDGKLTTGTKNPRIPFVLETFVNFGADESIRYDAKPHIGTDVLVNVVQNLRREVIRLGGEVRFCTRFDGYTLQNGAIASVEAYDRAKDRTETIPAGAVILAAGHSARDTFSMLLENGASMEPKPFSMGVRIEHRQQWLNKTQYGAAAEKLPPADYKLNVTTKDGVGVYTFCMCPGGYVMTAASEMGGVVTNGMSNFAREGENSNAALLVSVNPEDFPFDGPLGGMLWQRQIEQKAFAAGGGNYKAPAQLVGDFMKHKKSAALGSVAPTYRPDVALCDLHDVLPKKLTDAMEEALPLLDRKLPGFAAPDAVMTAPETRSSSPVRIVRDPKTRQSVSIGGLYPCGEGAGYAGGIMSAAVDGIMVAEAVIQSLNSDEKVSLEIE